MIKFIKTAYEIMVKDAKKTFPFEGCGFLFGEEKPNGEREVSQVLLVNNSDYTNPENRFSISPLDYLKAEEYALNEHLDLLGVYHSHPNHPAIPSETDRVNAQPYFSYVIVAIKDGNFDHFRSWRLNDEFQFDEETTTVIENFSILNLIGLTI